MPDDDLILDPPAGDGDGSSSTQDPPAEGEAGHPAGSAPAAPAAGAPAPGAPAAAPTAAAPVQISKEEYDQLKALVSRVPQLQKQLAKLAPPPNPGAAPKALQTDEQFLQQFLQQPRETQKQMMRDLLREEVGGDLDTMREQTARANFDSSVKEAAGEDYPTLQPHMNTLMTKLADQLEANPDDPKLQKLSEFVEMFPQFSLVPFARQMASRELAKKAQAAQGAVDQKAIQAAQRLQPGGKAPSSAVTPEQLKSMSLEDMEKLGGAFAEPVPQFD